MFAVFAHPRSPEVRQQTRSALLHLRARLLLGLARFGAHPVTGLA
ncbi:hypothetical protein [Saccharothrix lopnurensis]|uniref:Uncharacterized protein n=1 Tax=Saccharothrix lopnurensis TaxID=1670621 RepID=A0ABW1P458_9PSEU